MSDLDARSDRQLRKAIRAAERTLERLASVDVQKAVRERRADALLAEGERAVAASRAASEELLRRRSQRRRGPASLTGIIPTRRRVTSGGHPAAAALRAVATFGHPELSGITLVASRLSDEEGLELAGLVKRLSGARGGEELTSNERSRYERLLGQCAADEDLFAARRREKAAREKLAVLTKQSRVAALPHRPKYEEPGAVVLPAVVFEWLLTSRDASWTIADVGVLVALLGSFANRDASLIVGAVLERDGDGDLLVVPEDVRFLPDANPHAMQGGAGHVNAAVALATLARNAWIDVRRGDGVFKISLGERGRDAAGSA